MHIQVRGEFVLVWRIQLASGITVLNGFTLYSRRGITLKRSRERHQDSQWKNLV